MPSSFWNDVNVEPKRSFRWVGYINFYKPSGGGGTLSEAASIKPFLVSSYLNVLKIVISHPIS